MPLKFIAPTAPAKLIAAREHAEKLRGAIARATETANATAEAIDEAEKSYRCECSAAALDGICHPKTPAALRDLRERAETARNVVTDLQDQLAAATESQSAEASVAKAAAFRADFEHRATLSRGAISTLSQVAATLVFTHGADASFILRKVAESLPRVSEQSACFTEELGRTFPDYAGDMANLHGELSQRLGVNSPDLVNACLAEVTAALAA